MPVSLTRIRATENPPAMPSEQQLESPPTAADPAPAGTNGKEAEKEEVKGYYSESDEVNRVQRNIRIGHQKTVDNVLAWLQEQGDLASRSFCDAGCGVGSLSIPLAQLGAGSIAASDLSEAMASEGRRRAEAAGISGDQLQFSASDLESLEGRYDTVICLDGRYDTVICLDVFIHYPQAAAEEMVRHLAGMAEKHLIVSFAPYTPLLALLKGIGQLFPGPSKTTRAYTLREDGIVAAAAEAGFQPVSRSLNQAPFYFSRLIAFERG